NFVDACLAVGKQKPLDGSCFDKHGADRADCKAMFAELEQAMRGPAKPPEPAPAAAPAQDGRCEALRDKFLAWSADRAKGAIESVTDKHQHDELQAEADKELAIAKDKFVGACAALGDVDSTCFDRPQLEKRCQSMVHALETKMFAH